MKNSKKNFQKLSSTEMNNVKGGEIIPVVGFYKIKDFNFEENNFEWYCNLKQTKPENNSQTTRNHL